MTLTLRAVALDGSPLIKAIEARFAPPGGTIGRSIHSRLVLPDPNRHISRTQAEVVAGDHDGVIKNVGSANPIMVQGRTLEVGESMPLRHGDWLRIGGYSLEVRDSEFDDDLEAAKSAEAQSPRRLVEDPAEALPGAAPRHPPPGPDDWPVMTPTPSDSQQGTSPGRVGAQAAVAFGLDDSRSGPIVNPFADLLGVPEHAGSQNPLADFLTKREAETGDAQGPVTTSGNAGWSESAPMPGSETLPVPLSEWASQKLDRIEASSHEAPHGSHVVTEAVVPPPGSDAEAMWLAFCEGAGIRLDAPDGASLELMRLAGKLLRTAVDGTLQLVTVRSALRYELHAQVTVIKARNNNPLKFAPDAVSALEQLLQPPMRGFLPGPAAMTDVMNDLVGHAIGTMAGTRAALEGVLGRFAPDQLEAQLTDESVLDSVLPMNRKSKLWQLYLQHYEAIRDEAHEDFHALFGKAFLEAYDQQLERLRQEKASGQR